MRSEWRGCGPGKRAGRTVTFEPHRAVACALEVLLVMIRERIQGPGEVEYVRVVPVVCAMACEGVRSGVRVLIGPKVHPKLL